MGKFKITFSEEQKVYMAEEGMTVLDAERAAGLTPDAPCGGKGTCGKCKIRLDGEVQLACQTIIHSDLVIDTGVRKEQQTQILMEGESRKCDLAPDPFPADVEHPLLAAVDLGTTTVVAYLLDGKTGELLARKSMLNPQRQYGADVIMRSSYAMEHGSEVLGDCIRRAVTVLLREAARECGGSWEDIVQLVMVGNTCMHHLFLEIPTDSLVLAPYEPKVKHAIRRKASECGIQLHPEAEVCWLPIIGGFVGADTVGCILSAAMDTEEKLTLMVDIGTNGEMVLGNKDGLTACSTAAGPAFEGAKISCGMRGSEGAIDHVWIENDQICWHVIGDVAPTGICGSGLLDAVACFLKKGIVDESGKMDETFYFTQDVYLNQRDIRELQLAKAAIAAGIRMLCKQRGVKVDAIEQLLLAGAFGNYMDPESACAIGLLPTELRGRIHSIGNAAGDGAQMAVLNAKEYLHSTQLAEHTECIELALDPEFQDVYVDEMEFPE
jgi:uncharacterized 2Fe-2S/4Fe-4S cluster protein (DUF4445 family)